jgi:hypothetical protein
MAIKGKLPIALLLFALLPAVACNNPKADEQETVENKPSTSINITSRDVAVKEAFLSDDQGQPLTEETVNPGQRFILNIILDTGWVKQEGKSSIGAKERLAITSTHTVVASVDDLFADSAGIMDAQAAKQIKLGGFINPGSQTRSDYTMSFQVWDKKGPGTVWGSYRVKLRDSCNTTLNQ